MKEKPADGKYTRKGERDGKRLTPGERAINWAKAAAIIIPLLGIGAVADEPIKQFFTGHLEEVDGQTELSTERKTFEESVVKFSQEIRIELDEIKQAIARIRAQSHRDDSQLSERVKKIEQLVN